ncbi:bifunctional glutamate N-acetyltransferase/amino-acid acetyltransferase ArgJ [Halarsenatibacter silvermanii]|uniref:Arginine biosynthesis bifunctional protein ArgJ n=1 Tax=Halarsenatibacter silvermanii TaxID=321763 RepID=A0A1G9J5E7_9FIRM|nr:bifunctional glutamate N-acetyltransferase/amino-acid acetyltransferase ArgJ [Halarsenatibacter silvermanii]SDL32384.1 glutamate N-acetyltransferase [Halarsenatibacter silvermanii]
MENLNEVSGGITAARGFKAAGVKTGIKNNSFDLAIIKSQKKAKAAAVYTTNQVQAAPIEVCRNNLEDGTASAVVVNSGISNACTGKQGLENAYKMVEKTGEELGVNTDEVIVASTGIIGKQLPMEKIEAGIESASKKLDRNSDEKAAKAILTTDTTTKQIAVKTEIEGEALTVSGMAKGSGMIEPDMATMLSFITTDADINNQLLQKTLKAAVDNSFNKITVDGDQSTNDMVAVLASGQADIPKITAGSSAYEKFTQALHYVAEKLAKMIVKDGEGGTKFIEIEVGGAASLGQAEKAARQIANSPLVKTAIFGESPSWGRIAAAAGSADDEFDLEDLKIVINGEEIFGPEEYVHSFSKDILTRDRIDIVVDLGLGDVSEKIWTCDFSYEYVEINAKYYS